MHHRDHDGRVFILRSYFSNEWFLKTHSTQIFFCLIWSSSESLEFAAESFLVSSILDSRSIRLHPSSDDVSSTSGMESSSFCLSFIESWSLFLLDSASEFFCFLSEMLVQVLQAVHWDHRSYRLQLGYCRVLLVSVYLRWNERIQLLSTPW